MNCLPIAERELRVAARKRSTFWLRVAAGIAGLAIGCGAFIVSAMEGTGPSEIGRVLFYVLAWICLLAALATGLFFTSDCLSEEKREGTLGLLFLTELRGYDVILGKVMASSLRAVYALLAVLPILAITQLMGGISGGQYWKTSLALVNALLLSIAGGMLVSTVSRDSQKALGVTLLLLLSFALGGPAADLIIASVSKRTFHAFWSTSSPAYALVAASAWGRSPYWTAVLVTQGAGWAMLALACAWVPRTWQEKKRAANTTQGWSYSWKYGGVRRRQQLRRKFFESRPVAWLVCRERWQSRVLWTVAILVLAGFVAILALETRRESWILWYYLGGLFTSLLYLAAASQACRFFVEARRGGMLELILVSPVTEGAIVHGQWRAMLRMFSLPALLLLSVQLAAAALSQLSFQRLAAQVNTAMATAVATNQVSTTTNVTVTVGPTASVSVTFNGAATTNTVTTSGTFQPPSRARQAGMVVGAAAVSALSTAANLVALCWFGMWMGMTSRSANLATLKTVAFVQAIPWLVIAFAANVLVGVIFAHSSLAPASGRPGALLMWWPLLTAGLSAALTIGKDLGFIAWSRSRLHSSFRAQATQGFARFSKTTAQA